MTAPGMVGDPVAAGRAVLRIVDADEPPLRALCGTVPSQVVPGLRQQRLYTLEQWKPVSIDANGH